MAWEPDYVTGAQLKEFADADALVDDTWYEMWATTASRAVDNWCHRQFGKVDAPQERSYEARYDRARGCWVAEIDDLQDTTGLIVVDELDAAIDGYRLEPRNALQKGKPYERIRLPRAGDVYMTAPWGWNEIPAPVKTAAFLQGNRFAFRKDSPHGIAGSPNEGGEQRLLAQLDPDLKTALGRKYRREVWAA